MDSQFISQLLQDHGTSGVLAFSLGWFIIKKLPQLIERHVDGVEKQFKAIRESLTSLSEREDDRHRELIAYINEVRVNGAADQQRNTQSRGSFRRGL